MGRHLTRRLGVLVLLAVLVLDAGPRRARGANGAAPSAVGPRGFVALPMNGDAQTVFRMPSSVGWLGGHRADLNALVYRSIGDVKNSANDYRLDAWTPAGSAGVVLSGRQLFLGAAEDAAAEEPSDFVFGIGEYVHLAGGGTNAKLFSTTFPEGKKTATGITFLTTALSAAYAPTDWISIGGGLHLIHGRVKVRSLIEGKSTQLNGSPQILGVPLPGNPTYADFLAIFASDQATDPTTFVQSDLTGFQLGGTLSLSVRPLSNLGVGFAYSPQPYALTDFEGDAKVDASRTFSAALSGLSPAVQQLFLGTLPRGGTGGFVGKYDMTMKGLRVPQTVRANIAFLPHERVLIAAEVAWYEWSRALRARVQLDGGSNQDLNHVIGSSSVSTKLIFNWKNQWVFSFQTAVVAVPDLLVVRAGVNYGRSPVDPNYVGNGPNSGLVDVNLAGGLGVYLGPCEISVLVEHALHSGRHARQARSLTTQNGYYSSKQFFFHLGVGIDF